jgi:hypothetical protein
MPEFMLHHTHDAEPCDEIFPQLEAVGQALNGQSFFCTCPSGEHGGFFRVEAAGADEALGMLPADMRTATTVFAGEQMTIPA